jgi:hypothetical protein
MQCNTTLVGYWDEEREYKGGGCTAHQLEANNRYDLAADQALLEELADKSDQCLDGINGNICVREGTTREASFWITRMAGASTPAKL